MALYLTEKDVTQLLTMPEAVRALEAIFRRAANGEAINQPRRRLFMPQGTYHTMVAADLGLRTFGIKTYASFPPQTRFLFLLYDAQNGDLLSLMEADKLGQVRTGAASGVATRYLAKPDGPLRLGIYGTGWQAQSQLEAVAAVREVSGIVVYSRNEAHRAAFCQEMTDRLGLPVTPVSHPEAAAEGQDVVITATSAREPVLRGEWLSPGAHVNAIGSNQLTRREVDEETIRRSAVVVVDSVEQAKGESGDLLVPYERRLFRWEQAVELADVVTGRHPGRTDGQQITLFKSNGIALEDVAVATLVYEKARAANVGVEIPMWVG
ncbi:MAG TPA: ornithine cyclodeaminase family protein [Chthonomonadaceae bacterium]|jgi:ornithine cyclodeaminase/alanine dehydrogenase-like protein (mu-crystallin family)|nr:ornithine cyclodeaminase family protein [Chthonomonadaceae bacterium]